MKNGLSPNSKKLKNRFLGKYCDALENLQTHTCYKLLLIEKCEKLKLGLLCILKSRDITLPTKAHLVKAMVFPVLMYGCESWIVKKAEHQRIDAFELWCWGRILRVPWTARR